MNTPDQAIPAETRDPPKLSFPAILKLSETEPAVTVATCQELDQILHKTQLRCTPEHPIVVALYMHGHRLETGLGLPKSFVSIQDCEPATGPSFISIGDARADWGVAFFFRGFNRTEVPERNLLPATKARQVLREYFETGLRSTHIDWETL